MHDRNEDFNLALKRPHRTNVSPKLNDMKSFIALYLDVTRTVRQNNMDTISPLRSLKYEKKKRMAFITGHLKLVTGHTAPYWSLPCDTLKPMVMASSLPLLPRTGADAGHPEDNGGVVWPGPLSGTERPGPGVLLGGRGRGPAGPGYR